MSDLFSRGRSPRWLDDPRAVRIVGGVVSVGIALALFSRYSLSGTLSRDEGIYLYGGQQLARHGVAPYASIFDPKGPLADMLCALGVAVANLFGLHDVRTVRVLFLLMSLATVLGIYLLAQRVFHSPLAGVVAAAVFASFNGFADDAVQGPDAKTPAVLFSVFAMWLATHRRWFWVGVLSGLCVLTWQPMITFAIVFTACALLLPTDDERRIHWRPFGQVLLGTAAPIAAAALYFVVDGSWHYFWESAVLFPLTGIKRGNETFGQHLSLIGRVINTNYPQSGKLIWIGAVLLVVVVVVVFVRNGRRWRDALCDPVVCIVFATGLLQVLYSLYDFQGYPDTLPLLPYPALGIAGAVALVVQAVRAGPARIWAEVAFAALTLVLVAFSWTWLEHDPRNDRALTSQLADACALHRSLGPNQSLWSLGYPPALILTERTNPDRFIYLESGVARWKINHTPGGLHGWQQEILRENPGAVVVFGWHNSLRDKMAGFLRDSGYHFTHFGLWPVFLDDAAKARALRNGVDLSPERRPFATDVQGRRLPAYRCLPPGG